jgi:hypothetical protein
MLSTATGLVILATCTLAVFAQVRFRSPLISFLTLVNAIYLAAILPKTLLYHVHGSAVFLTATAPLSALQVNAAVMVASLFVVGINLGWLACGLLVARIPVKSGRATTGDRLRQSLQGVDGFSAIIGLPAALVATGVLAYGIHVSGGHLMQKLGSYPTDDTQLVYIAQKAAQGAKCVFYLYLVKLLAEGWPMSARANLFFCTSVALTLFAFISVGQRSGIFLLLLQSAFLLQARKSLSPRMILVGLGGFLILSIVIVMMRDTTENTGFFFVNLARRYFFEIEKLAGIAMLFEASGAAIGSLWDLLTQVSHLTVPLGNLHEYLGREVLGSKSAVPPTIVGEAWLFLGAASVLPLALLLGSVACVTERLLHTAKNPVLLVLAATVLTLAAYFFLNTDSVAFVKRLMLELVLMTAGWIGLILFNWVRRTGRYFPRVEDQ